MRTRLLGYLYFGFIVFSSIMILYFGGYRYLLDNSTNPRGDMVIVSIFLPLLVLASWPAPWVLRRLLRKTQHEKRLTNEGGKAT